MRVYLDVMQKRPSAIVARYHRLSGIVQVVNKVYRKSYRVRLPYWSETGKKRYDPTCF
jgi:hypothetical protein